MNDGEILALLKKRDEAAVEAINERFGGLCFSLASNILKDRRDVEECVSRVYFKLWSSIPPAEPRDLAAYVAKAARNEALMKYRADSSARRFTASIPLEELENCISGNDEAVEIDVFMRRYWFFDSAKTIAERFGTTEKRVNTLLAKTRRQLRRYLIKEEYINE